MKKALLHARYLAETLLVCFLLGLFRLLPLGFSSWLGGALARIFGPHTNLHDVALHNLARALPSADHAAIARGMWDHIGRVFAELSSLPGVRLTQRCTVHGLEHLPQNGAPTLFVSGHYGNWELVPASIFDHGIALTIVYRHLNNPYLDHVLQRLRDAHCTRMLAKGHRGAVQIARTLQSGLSMAMLVDQKMNEGIEVPFFGMPAMTAPAIAQLALRYDMPIIPLRVVRGAGCQFDVTFFPPLTVQKTGDDAADTLAIMTSINRLLEGWIREHPEQWFWIHKRWGSL